MIGGSTASGKRFNHLFTYSVREKHWKQCEGNNVREVSRKLGRKKESSLG